MSLINRIAAMNRHAPSSPYSSEPGCYSPSYQQSSPQPPNSDPPPSQPSSPYNLPADTPPPAYMPPNSVDQQRQQAEGEMMDSQRTPAGIPGQQNPQNNQQQRHGRDFFSIFLKALKSYF